MLRRIGALCCALGLLPISAQAATVTVRPADAPTIKRAIAAEKGHVVVVNFWATWCVPCMAEFPALVKFNRRYKSRGVVVMAVSADQRRDVPTKVQPFLVRQKAFFPAFLEQADDPEDFINAFDPSWQGELPRTLVYDKHGRLVKSTGNSQTVHSLAALVKPLL